MLLLFYVCIWFRDLFVSTLLVVLVFYLYWPVLMQKYMKYMHKLCKVRTAILKYSLCSKKMLCFIYFFRILNLYSIIYFKFYAILSNIFLQGCGY